MRAAWDLREFLGDPEPGEGRELLQLNELGDAEGPGATFRSPPCVPCLAAVI